MPYTQYQTVPSSSGATDLKPHQRTSSHESTSTHSTDFALIGGKEQLNCAHTTMKIGWPSTSNRSERKGSESLSWRNEEVYTTASLTIPKSKTKESAMQSLSKKPGFKTSNHVVPSTASFTTNHQPTSAANRAFYAKSDVEITRRLEPQQAMNHHDPTDKLKKCLISMIGENHLLPVTRSYIGNPLKRVGHLDMRDAYFEVPLESPYSARPMLTEYPTIHMPMTDAHTAHAFPMCSSPSMKRHHDASSRDEEAQLDRIRILRRRLDNTHKIDVPMGQWLMELSNITSQLADLEHVISIEDFRAQIYRDL